MFHHPQQPKRPQTLLEVGTVDDVWVYADRVLVEKAFEDLRVSAEPLEAQARDPSTFTIDGHNATELSRSTMLRGFVALWGVRVRQVRVARGLNNATAAYLGPRTWGADGRYAPDEGHDQPWSVTPKRQTLVSRVTRRAPAYARPPRHPVLRRAGAPRRVQPAHAVRVARRLRARHVPVGPVLGGLRQRRAVRRGHGGAGTGQIQRSDCNFRPRPAGARRCSPTRRRARAPSTASAAPSTGPTAPRARPSAPRRRRIPSSAPAGRVDPSTAQRHPASDCGAEAGGAAACLANFDNRDCVDGRCEPRSAAPTPTAREPRDARAPRCVGLVLAGGDDAADAGSSPGRGRRPNERGPNGGARRGDARRLPRGVRSNARPGRLPRDVRVRRRLQRTQRPKPARRRRCPSAASARAPRKRGPRALHGAVRAAPTPSTRAAAATGTRV